MILFSGNLEKVMLGLLVTVWVGVLQLSKGEGEVCLAEEVACAKAQSSKN